MSITFREATLSDSETIGTFVVMLTNEISKLTNSKHFDIDLNGTIKRCHELIRDGHYSALIGISDRKPIAVVTMTETYALYVCGKIGVIQEFYVSPEFRGSGVGSMLVEQVQNYGKKNKTATTTAENVAMVTKKVVEGAEDPIIVIKIIQLKRIIISPW